MKEKLKPCPFCGGKAILNAENITAAPVPTTYYRVFCAECPCTMGVFMYADEAIEAWNRRA